MTEKQFELAKSKGIKFYKVYFSGSKLHKELVPIHEIEGHWITISWINTTTYYGTDDIRGRYVSEDQFEKQVDKYFKDLRRDYLDEIREAKKMLKKIDSAIESAKRSMIIDESTSNT